MDEFKIYILEQITKSEKELETLKTKIEESQKAIDYCTGLHEDPDGIDKEYLNSIVPDELKTEKYSKIIGYIGSYKSCSDQPQIVSCIHELKKLEEKIISTRTREIEKITNSEEVKEKEQELEKYKEVESIVEKYDPNKVLDREKFLLISGAMKESGIKSGELTKFLAYIIKTQFSLTKHNVIERLSTEKVEKPIEIDSKERDEITRKRRAVRKGSKENEKEKEDYLAIFENLPKQQEIIDQKLYDKMLIILEKAKRAYRDYNKDEVVNLEDFIDELDLFLGGTTTIEELRKNTFVALLDAYTKQDEERIQMIIDLYTYNPLIDNEEYAEILEIEQAYEKQSKESQEKEKEEQIPGLYDSKYQTPIVFLDEDLFIQNVRDIMSAHKDADPGQLAEKIKNMVGLEITDFHNTKLNKPIKGNKKHKETYGIRSFKPTRHFRIGNRPLENSGDDRIILLISASYGNTDGAEKQDGLIANIVYFEDKANQAEYERINKIFSSNATEKEKAEAQKKLKEASDVYIELVKMGRKFQKEQAEKAELIDEMVGELEEGPKAKQKKSTSKKTKKGGSKNGDK